MLSVKWTLLATLTDLQLGSEAKNRKAKHLDFLNLSKRIDTGKFGAKGDVVAENWHHHNNTTVF